MWLLELYVTLNFFVWDYFKLKMKNTWIIKPHKNKIGAFNTNLSPIMFRHERAE